MLAKLRANKKSIVFWGIYGVMLISLYIFLKLNLFNSEFLGSFLCVVLLLGFYGLVISAFCLCELPKKLAELSGWEKLFLLCCYFFSNLLILSILLKTRYIRFWDFGGYWGVTIEQSSQIFTNPFLSLKNLYVSINNDEYNRLIPTLMSLPLKILGVDFPMYALLVYNMFIIPSFLAIYLTIIKFCKKNLLIISAICFFLFPSIYSPVLLGYLDAFSLLCLSIAIMLATDGIVYDVRKDRAIFLAVFLVLAVMGRRYFAFACVAIAISVFLVGLIRLLTVEVAEKKKLFVILVSNLVIILIITGIIMAFFQKFIELSTTGTIGLAYAAYQKTNLVGNYFLLIKYFGLIYIIFSIIGMVLSVRNKETRIESLFLFFYFAIATLLFYSVQSMGNHHYYICLIPIVVFASTGFFYFINSFKSTGKVLIAVYLSLNFIFTIGVADNLKNIDNFKILFSNQRMVPQVRNDIHELRKIAADMKEYSDDGHYIYMVASSTIINDDIIRKIDMPDEPMSVNNLYVSSAVDLRDGFPKDFLNADIVYVATPTQYHLDPDGQRVVGILYDEILEGNLSRLFNESKEYKLDGGVVLKCFIRNSAYSQDDLEELANQFDVYYKDYPDLFRNRILNN